MKRRILFFSLGLGLLTSVAIGLAEAYLPNSSSKSVLIDAAALPGALLASVCYPEGVHTGRGAPNWGIVVILLNWVVYCIFWALVLVALQVAGRHSRHSSTVTMRSGGPQAGL